MFSDRRDAGRRLAARLMHLKGEAPLVLAIPRGGVAVAREVADALAAPLDMVLVRKIGAPWQPELAVGAVVDGERPETVLNREVVELLGVPESFIAQQTARELEEIERRRRIYVADRAHPRIEGRTVIVVDDGIATGATVRAALVALRRHHPLRLVLAVPVAPSDTVESLREQVDELVCLHSPSEFFAISQFYGHFPQLSDAEVTGLLGQPPGVDQRDQAERAPRPA